MIAKNNMNKKKLLLLVLSLVNIGLLYGEDQTEKLFRKSGSIYRIVNDKLIELDKNAITVKLKEGKVLSKNVKSIRSNVLGYIDVEVPNDTDIEDFMANLKTTGDYELVKYNVIGEIGISSNDTESSNQWHLGAIGMYSTWEISSGNPTIKVAVIDNGFDCAHEDIGYGTDSYRNIDPTLGYDYYLMSSTSMTKNDHGTQVAGIISAKTNNGTGIAGVAGGFGASGVTILPFCITDGTLSGVNFGYLDDAICSAVNNGAKVINMSLGTMDIDLSHHIDIVDAIDYAYSHGVTLISATGNFGYSYIAFPACYSKVIAVGAMDQNYQKRYSSNYGDGLDLVAPGEDIYSTKKDNDYGASSGTSFAAPQVAGVAALMLSVNPSLTPSQIRNKLRSTCTKLSGYSYNTSGWNNYVGYGLLNAYAAVCSALSGDRIVGPQLVYNYGDYSIENLPSGVTVSWSLSDNHYNTGYNLLLSNCPLPCYCRIFRDHNHDLLNATLTAEIKYNNVTIQTLTKDHLYAYDGFRGQYTSGNLSGNIDYTFVFTVKANYVTTVTSPNFYGATVTYSSSGATPTAWGFNPSTSVLNFKAPPGSAPVVINAVDVCANQYTLYAFPSGAKNIDVSYEDNSLAIILNDNDDDSDGSREDEPWTMEIRNAMTGELMTTQNSNSRSTSVSTAGWPKGMYVVRVTIGNEVLTEKVVIK